MNNIDLTSYSWVPFGGDEGNPLYSGTFNGQGYKIIAVDIDDTSDYDVGFFGETYGTIENVGVGATVIGDTYNGGLVGVQYGGSISHSYVSGSVSGGYSSVNGGLVGEQGGGSISDSYVIGSVSGSNSYNGGLVGQQFGNISDSYATVSVSGTGFRAFNGGLVGVQYTPSNISYSYATGLVSGGAWNGGLVGLQSGGGISESYFDSVTSGQTSGVGENNGGTGTVVPLSSTTTPWAGWDFANTWAINSSVNNGFPFFRPQILTTTLPPADVGQSYSYTVTGFNGTGEGKSWSATGLPNGMSISSAGVITGIPTESGTFDVHVQSEDNAGDVATVGLTLNAIPQVPDIATQSIAPGNSLGSTEVTVTPNNSGDTFAYGLGSSPELTPNVGDPVPNGATTYISGSDIPNVIADQYLEVYEVNGSNQIQAWHEYRLTSGDINSAGPTGLTHSGVTQTGWTESWNPVSGSGLGTVTYGVYLNGNQVGTSVTDAVYNFTGEAPGTTYDVTVKSVNGDGVVSAASSVDSVTTLTNLSGAPTGLAHTDVSQTGWTETWNPVTGSGLGSVTYAVYLDGSQVGMVDSPTYMFTGETPGTTYDVTVESINANDVPGGTSADTVTTSAAVTPPSSPQTQRVQQLPPPFTGVNGFDTVLSWVWLGPNASNWSIDGLDGTQVLLEVPTGVLNKQDAIRLTTADASTLQNLTKGLHNITILGGYEINIAEDTPSGSMKLWLKNLAWHPGAMVYAVNKDASLTSVPVEELSSGWLQITVTPDNLAQGGNFIIVLPNAAKNLKVNEGLLEWDGIAQKMPTVGGLVRYGGLFYVMEALKLEGIESHWNGKVWTISTDASVSVTETAENPQAGYIPVVVNGTTVSYVPALAAPDGWTNRQTTYVSIPDVNSILKSVFGTSTNWVYGK